MTAELHERSTNLPKHVVPLLNSLPKDMHPMTQFSIGLNAAQTASVFAKAYGELSCGAGGERVVVLPRSIVVLKLP